MVEGAAITNFARRLSTAGFFVYRGRGLVAVLYGAQSSISG